MERKTFLYMIVLGFFLISCIALASSYICIDESKDNEGILIFKQRLNLMSLKNDIENNGITERGFYSKLKYFNPCS